MAERVVKRVENWKLVVPGEAPTGWLPENAAQPKPKPHREVTCNVEIRFDGTGWMLVCQSEDPGFCSDTWHQSLDAAERQAVMDFGIKASQWQSTS